MGFLKRLSKNDNGKIKFSVGFSLFFGIIIAWLFSNPLTMLLFSGSSYWGRSFIFKITFFLLYTLFFSLVCLILYSILQKRGWFSKRTDRLFDRYLSLVNLIKTNSDFQVLIALFIIGLGVTLIFITNNILPSIDTKSWEYRTNEILPTMSPVGADFRVGFYQPAQQLFVGKSIQEIWSNNTNTTGYPPLVTLLGSFFLQYDENSAYLVQVLLLILANIASLTIAWLFIKKYFLTNLKSSEPTSHLISFFIFFGILFFTFSSYAFAFSIERGNYDIFAILFALISVWILLSYPNKVWAQVILLSIATHLKIYPAILFILLFKKNGTKIIFPTIVTNLVLLFILGPNNAIAFINKSLAIFGIGNGYTWIGNHSSYSFVDQLNKIHVLNLENAFMPVWIIFTLIPIIIWGIGTFILFRKKYSPQVAVLFYMLSIPMMDLIPTVSHDYKLVILSSAIIILLASIIRCITQKPSPTEYIQLVLIFVILLFIGRSYFFIESKNLLLDNKFIWSLFLEGIMLWNIFRIRHIEKSFTEEGSFEN
jgi:hypothetical protein